LTDDDLPSDRLERALFLMNLMIERATGNHADDATYRLLRREFMGDQGTSDLLPRYVRTCRDIEAFWPVAKGLDPKWEGRRVQIRRDFEPLLDFLERAAGKPLDGSATEVLTGFSADGVAAVWQKGAGAEGRRP
jgi:hypothetical protein